jgi:hypothetical protein
MSHTKMIDEKYANAVSGMKNEWFLIPDGRWYDHVMQLPVSVQTTYLIVVLHNQVLNGGFHQYFFNGYGQFASETIIRLKQIGALTNVELLHDAIRLVNSGELTESEFREMLLKKKIKALFDDTRLETALSTLDDAYYANEKEQSIIRRLTDYLIRSEADELH